MLPPTSGLKSKSKQETNMKQEAKISFSDCLLHVGYLLGLFFSLEDENFAC
jgi:hypothetical protein